MLTDCVIPKGLASDGDSWSLCGQRQQVLGETSTCPEADQWWIHTHTIFVWGAPTREWSGQVLSFPAWGNCSSEPSCYQKTKAPCSVNRCLGSQPGPLPGEPTLAPSAPASRGFPWSQTGTTLQSAGSFQGITSSNSFATSLPDPLCLIWSDPFTKLHGKGRQDTSCQSGQYKEGPQDSDDGISHENEKLRLEKEHLALPAKLGLSWPSVHLVS